MKSNKDIFNEAFFKKETYTDKLRKKLPQYTPVNVVNKDGSVVNSTFDVSDTDAVKKRLAGTFGVTFGNNNIKSIASRALKTFPILVSDIVEPDTIVMLKRLFEEQYAQYINLLVSNQIVDLSQYNPDDPSGNIAMQALDTLSGTDFSSTRIANKAANTGEVDAEDLFKNIALARVLKENAETVIPSFDDSIIDTLLEDAIVLPDDQVGALVEYMQNHAEELSELLEKDETGGGTKNVHAYEDYEHPDYMEPGYVRPDNENEKIPFENYINNLVNSNNPSDNKNNRKQSNNNPYSKLVNTSLGMVVDKITMDKALDRTVGEILYDKGNEAIHDRFQKAVFLLESGRISGKEFISYVTVRLGIPVPARVRNELIILKVKSGIKNDKDFSGDFLTAEEANNINKNRTIVEKGVKGIYATTARSIVVGVGSTAVGATAGALYYGATAGTIGAGVGTASTTLAAIAAACPWLLPVFIGAASGAAVFAITKIISSIKKKVDFKKQQRMMSGWERVEALINAMDRARAEVVSGYKTISGKPADLSFNINSGKVSNAISAQINTKLQNPKIEEIARQGRYTVEVQDEKSVKDELDALKSRLDKLSKSAALTESYNVSDSLVFSLDEDIVKEGMEAGLEAIKECAEDKDYMAAVLDEALFTTSPTTTPVKTVYKTDDKVSVIPAYAASSNYAYGSTEIDARVAKDRRYDQPLIMTIRFNGRYSDGRTSDNQLTAVIGILGKVIRIPSEEMKYILQANIDGETIRGLFDGGNIKNLVGELLSTSKISKDVKNLPQSADVWKNLEKVATLAAANKYAGKKTNNIANAHIVFSQKEIDDVRTETGVDYFRQMKLVANLMKRYSAFTLMVANDPGQKLYTYDDLDAISWNVVPYSALMKDNGNDQLTAALSRLGTLR